MQMSHKHPKYVLQILLISQVTEGIYIEITTCLPHDNCKFGGHHNQISKASLVLVRTILQSSISNGCNNDSHQAKKLHLHFSFGSDRNFIDLGKWLIFNQLYTQGLELLMVSTHSVSWELHESYGIKRYWPPIFTTHIDICNVRRCGLNIVEIF